MPRPSTTVDLALPDGTTVHIRRLRPDDGPRLLDMWSRTSERSRRLRFHGHFALTGENVGQFVDYDQARQFALAATTGRGDHERIVGVARWVRDDRDGNEAEFAILVQDDQQGRGLGTLLIRQLAISAAEAGIDTLSGDVLSENLAMLRVIRHLGLAHDDNTDHAVVRSDLGLDLGQEFLAVGDRADARASRAAMRRFLQPRSVALVGASATVDSVGGQLVAHLLAGRYTGRVHMVNPRATRILGRRAVGALSDLTTPPDLVVVAVPAEAVNDVVDEAGRMGCRAVCVISAGFADAGLVGHARQQELLEIAGSHGLRLVGPNALGLINTDPGVSLNVSLAPRAPSAGSHAIAAQGGAIGMAMLDQASARQVGISSFVSLGNGGEISANDLLQYWELDDRTDAVMLHLESFGDPRRFARIARRVSRSRPIVAVKAASTASGARASAVHNAASQVGETELDALFAQTGMIRTNSMPELFDVVSLLGHRGRVAAGRVGIVANAGGPGVVTADVCEHHGLDVSSLQATTLDALRNAVPNHTHVGNPLDLVVGSTADDFERALRVLADSDEVDVVVAVHAPLQRDGAAMAAAISNVHQACADHTPIVGVTMGDEGVRARLEATGVPTFSFPDAAARALGRVRAYGRWCAQPLGHPVRFDDIDRAAARTLLERAVAALEPGSHPAGATGWLDHVQTSQLLAAYGVSQPWSRLVREADEAARAQRHLDAPVAVKLIDPVLRRTTTGGVEVGRRSSRAAAAAVEQLRRRFPEATARSDSEFLVQEMVQGVEMVVTVRHHPSFGPVLATGAGGPNMELIRDLTTRITPLTDRDADEMIDSLRMRPLLEGYRGSQIADVPALKALLGRVSAMVEDLPEILELDFNPVFVLPEGVVVADARVRVHQARRPTKPGRSRSTPASGDGRDPDEDPPAET